MLSIVEKLSEVALNASRKGCDIRDVARIFHEIISKVHPELDIVIAQAREDAITLTFTASENLSFITISRSKKCLFCYVVDKGEELYLENMWEFSKEGYKSVSPARSSFGPYTFFAVPVKTSSEVIGAVGFISPGRGVFSDEDKTLFRIAANLLGMLMKETLKSLDELTGLLPRNAFYDLVDRIEGKLVLVVDVENLSQINTSLGFDKGDEVLRQLALLIKRHTDEDEVAARIGEDEFVAVFNRDVDIEKIVDEIHKELGKRVGIPVNLKYGYSAIRESVKAALQEAMNEMKMKSWTIPESGGWVSLNEEDLERLQSIDKPVVIHNIDEIIFANKKALEIVGLRSFEDAKRYNIFDFTAPEYKEMAYRRAKLVLETGMSLPSAIEKGFTVSGEPIVVVVDTKPVLVNGRRAVMITLEDVSERILKEASEKFIGALSRIIGSLAIFDTRNCFTIFEVIQTALPNVNIAIYEVTRDGLILKCGRVGGKILENLKFSEEELPIVEKFIEMGKDLYLPDTSDFVEICRCPFGLDRTSTSHYGHPIKVKGEVRMVLMATRVGYDSMKPYEIDLLRAMARQIEKSLEAQLSMRELEEEKKKLMELAFRDPLTKAYTRIFFLEWLEKYRGRLKRLNEVAALVVMDVDCLKTINDTLGHETGDRVLEIFANHVMKNVRNMDIFVRWGGDEFLLVLPGVTREEAKSIMERIKSGCEVRFSYGISEISSEKGFEKAFKEADRRLYEMKSKKFDCEKIISTLKLNEEDV